MLTSIRDLPGYERPWAEAVKTANYLRNRIFTSAANEAGKTPYKAVMSKRSNVCHLRVFGLKAYMHISKQSRNSTSQECAALGILVGYKRGTRTECIFRNNVTSSCQEMYDLKRQLCTSTSRSMTKQSYYWMQFILIRQYSAIYSTVVRSTLYRGWTWTNIQC